MVAKATYKHTYCWDTKHQEAVPKQAYSIIRHPAGENGHLLVLDDAQQHVACGLSHLTVYFTPQMPQCVLLHILATLRVDSECYTLEELLHCLVQLMQGNCHGADSFQVEC